MNTPAWRTLVSATTLHEHLHDGNLVIVDCRFELGKPDAGRHLFQQAHLPGAVYAHLDADLSGPITTTSSRHPLPDIHILSSKLGQWGIDSSKQVVVYDADSGAMAAARLWWLLRWLGHAHVVVLDGGFKHWQDCGFEVTQSLYQPGPREFNPAINTDLLSTAETVAHYVSRPEWAVVDARAPERYAGETEPLDPVAGHVPGALNRPFALNLGVNGLFLPGPTLRTQFLALLGDVPSQHTIAMCGSGVTACHNLLAMEVAGLHGASLYAGSWSEWCKNPALPIATGRTP